MSKRDVVVLDNGRGNTRSAMRALERAGARGADGGPGSKASRWVMGFEVILGAYSPP